MGWRLRVVHTTEVSYAEPVRSSFNEVRMTPLTLPAQITLESRVTAGAGIPIWTYFDYWGTYVSVFDIAEPHEKLVIAAQATVETGSELAGPPPAPLPWPSIRTRASASRLLEYLLPTPLTTLTPAVAAAVLDDLCPAAGHRADPIETAEEIAARVRSHVRYMTGATGVRTNAQEAWDRGQGVCQDMAHATVALFREAGLPARYVSGYLHADPSAEPGSTIAGQSHAWAEYWAGSWLPVDPTSGAEVRDRHVVVGRGRDYADVSPMKGIYHGTPASTMRVTVEVTRLALAQPAESPVSPVSVRRARVARKHADEKDGYARDDTVHHRD
jgi:transglutaminase-like putative cysteine protease